MINENDLSVIKELLSYYGIITTCERGGQVESVDVVASEDIHETDLESILLLASTMKPTVKFTRAPNGIRITFS